MPRACTICAHRKRTEIDAALAAGGSYRSVATQFDAPPESVRRHKAHVPAKLAQAQEAAEVAEAGDLLAKITSYEKRAADLGRKAEEAGDLRTALQAVRELTRIVELLGKVRGELGDGGTTVNVGVIEAGEWTSLRGVILAALAPFPEARLAVAQALAAKVQA